MRRPHCSKRGHRVRDNLETNEIMREDFAPLWGTELEFCTPTIVTSL